MLSTTEIIEYFRLESSHAKKELGQNFLINKNIINKIVQEIDINKEDKILEIGPGLGALTEEIIDKCNNYSVVEYDEKFVRFLNNAYKNRNVVIYKNNIVKHKICDADKVVGNLPYYMTTEIIEHVLLNYPNLNVMVFMIQDECFKRIITKEGKDYNVINVLLEYLCEVTKCFDVKKEAFFPRPNVDSVVIKLTVKNEKNLSFAVNLKKITSILFHNRRKTIANNLNSLIKNKEVTMRVLEENNLSLMLRVESLKLADFVNITNTLLKLGIIKL